jgi:hypothetical protein
MAPGGDLLSALLRGEMDEMEEPEEMDRGPLR